VTRTLSYFLAGAFAGWLLLAGVGYALSPNDQFGLLCAAIVGPICIVPTTISLVMALWSSSRSSSEQLMAVVGGMGVRMAAVLGLSMLVFFNLPQVRENRTRELTFWAFVLIGYLATLALETALAAKATARTDESRSRDGGQK
jgi:hypothetical protein